MRRQFNIKDGVLTGSITAPVTPVATRMQLAGKKE